MKHDETPMIITSDSHVHSLDYYVQDLNAHFHRLNTDPRTYSRVIEHSHGKLQLV